MPRLTTSLRVAAAVRQATAWGAWAGVVRKGDADAGAILLCLNRLDGSHALLAESRDAEGTLGWHPLGAGTPLDAQGLAAAIERQLSYDPDLWVVEMEDKQGRNPFCGEG
ncbi:DUF1491 family protein [Roseospirillum parvum]|uniref:DUF1491 domain-containing protein n=1 Tax=Roseospirillum parvum TaxID=83401 RepID=A0A1G7ZCD1_9PROT|nr:DUF1491 family protein [Roseospirillum parvum]SDH06358.1 hypothetical protein SAMN05421742_10468 [Roseospirillum parvum]